MDTGKAYLGDIPLFGNGSLFPIEIDGVKYYEKDCHIFIANGNAVGLAIPNGTTPIFVAVDGVEKDYEREVKGNVFDNSTIHAIFDWDNKNGAQNWFSDILQFGYNSETGERNQLKSGINAFYLMEANPTAISNLDISNLTSMLYMFKESSFNQPIGEWDVSNVTDMGLMFFYAPFNQPIGNWDVSNVENMEYMFLRTPFNQPIGDWDVSNVENMTGMFKDTIFNQDISKWDVSSVTSMELMFSGSAFNQDIGDWDVSNLTSMFYMFRDASFNKPIGDWDTSNVTDMSGMFLRSIFNQDISKWDTSRVLNMYGMFQDASYFNQDLSQWCVTSVTNSSNFDQGATAWTLAKPVWGTCPRGEDTMPDGYSIEDCHIFIANGSEVNFAIPSGELPIFVAVNGVDVTPTTLTTRTVEVEEIGEDGETTTTTKEIQVAAISANNGDIIHAIFDWNNYPRWAHQDWFKDILQFGSRSVGNEPPGYENPPALASGRIPNQFKNVRSAFQDMKANPAIISKLDVSNATDMYATFSKAVSFNRPLSEWDTSNVTTMGQMFDKANAFDSDISGWDTSKVQEMGVMFLECPNFNKDISGWNTSSVTSMQSMFYYARKFNQNISQWCVNKVTRRDYFDYQSGFENQPAKQPQWGTCPRGEDKP